MQRLVERLVVVRQRLAVDAQHERDRALPVELGELGEEVLQVDQAVDGVGVGHPDRHDDVRGEHEAVDGEQVLAGRHVEQHDVVAVELVGELTREDLFAFAHRVQAVDDVGQAGVGGHEIQAIVDLHDAVARAPLPRRRGSSARRSRSG